MSAHYRMFTPREENDLTRPPAERSAGVPVLEGTVCCELVRGRDPVEPTAWRTRAVTACNCGRSVAAVGGTRFCADGGDLTGTLPVCG